MARRISIEDTLAYLASKNGFAMFDDIARLYNGLPEDASVPADMLYNTIEAYRSVSDSFQVTHPAIGFQVVSHRGKGQHNLTDKQFPKVAMPADTRPKMKRGRKADPDKAKDDDKTQNNWLPGLIVVDADFWRREETEAEAVADYQAKLDDLGLIGATVKTVRDGTMTVNGNDIPGVYVTMFVPTVE